LTNESIARLIQTLIWPILTVTYRVEAWTLNKELTGNNATEEYSRFPIPSAYLMRKCSTVWGSEGSYSGESGNVG